MAHSDGTDLSSAELQLDMFGAPPAPIRPDPEPDPEEVRAELADILAKARAAQGESLDASDASHFRNIFFRMADALPADEAAWLRLELETELRRLMAA